MRTERSELKVGQSLPRPIQVVLLMGALVLAVYPAYADPVADCVAACFTRFKCEKGMDTKTCGIIIASRDYCSDRCYPGPPQTGTITPKYIILSVLYSPPGTTQAGRTSQVQYGSASTIGVTTSASQSFQDTLGVELQAGVDAGVTGSATANFSVSAGFKNSQSLNITKTSSNSILATGPIENTIDHNYDQILVWLNPTLGLSITQSSIVPYGVTWSINVPPVMDVVPLEAGTLNGTYPMPPGTAATLNSYGISSSDYCAILLHDPLAAPGPCPVSSASLTGDAALSTARYRPVNETFSYSPPISPTAPVPDASSYSLSNASTDTTQNESTDSYTVSTSVQGGTDFIADTKTILKNTQQWTFTNSVLNSTSSLQTASLQVGGPPYGYLGPTDIEAYYDVIYGTFAFKFLSGRPAAVFTGHVFNSKGQPLSGRLVIATTRNHTSRAFTGPDGSYRLFGNIHEPAQISSGNMAISVKSAPATSVDIYMH